MNNPHAINSSFYEVEWISLEDALSDHEVLVVRDDSGECGSVLVLDRDVDGRRYARQYFMTDFEMEMRTDDAIPLAIEAVRRLREEAVK